MANVRCQTCGKPIRANPSTKDEYCYVRVKYVCRKMGHYDFTIYFCEDHIPIIDNKKGGSIIFPK